jgi:hypothetical protein
MSQLDFSIKNEYADIIIQCSDEIELYCSKFVLSKNKYFAGLFANNYIDKSKNQSSFNKDTMNIILNTIYNIDASILKYADIFNATALYEATNYYMMYGAHNEIQSYICNNIKNITLEPHFIETMCLYQDVYTIDIFMDELNEFTIDNKPKIKSLEKINLNININQFSYLLWNYTCISGQMYVYLLTSWISHYKDIDESLIKSILNAHNNKINDLYKNNYIYLYNYLKSSAYNEAFNFFKINTFEKIYSSYIEEDLD